LAANIRASSALDKFMRKLLQLGLVWAVLAVSCAGQMGTLTLLPWNNHRAAVSLTFDDADSVQLDKAVPELNRRQLRGTFFLTISKLTRLDDWRKVQLEGHEIGNHSVSHEHPSSLTKSGEELQVEDAKKFLDSNFQFDVCIFAYPYEESSQGLAFWVKKYDFAARGWRGGGDRLYVRPDADPDWYSLPSQPTYSRYDSAVYQGWIDKAISTGTWTTLQMHGIDDASTGWEPIPQGTLLFILNYVKAAEQRGLWVAPFGEVAAYFRAQRILQQTESHPVEGGELFTWSLPHPFPRGVVLKTRVRQDGRYHVFQRGRELHPDKSGVYSVSFDARELVVRSGL
jgi:peptidoglycan/xylan/chitin deacetylase (PgdA/CDA1 family)